MRFLFLFMSLCLVTPGHAQSKTYSFVFLNKKTSPQDLPKEETEKIMKGHMENINRLAAEGKLIAAGPFEGGGGIFILNTTSIDEAKLWLSTDPGIQANRWDVEIFLYTPRLGGVCSVKEPYEMVTYRFIRFTSESATANKNSAVILKQHEEYLKSLQKSGNIVTEGVFSEAGSILIAKGDFNDNLLAADPAVKQGIVSTSTKNLWIAKGSFCEQ